MKYTKQEIIDMINEEDVEFIRLQFSDIFGTMKNVAITVSQLGKALNNDISFDGSLIEGYAGMDESDLYLHPDLDTFTIFPWRPQQGKVARFICDVCKADGTPFEGDGRNVLKRVVKEAEKMGYSFDVGPECEFFLFHTDESGTPTTLTHENAGYFDVGPNDLGENARRDMVLNLETMGFEVTSSHHEVAPGQHEIDFKYDDALTTADNLLTFKLTIKSIAKRHGLHATFMPKPRSGVAGSGMHLNMSLSKEGKNIFRDENDKNGLSKEAYSFMAGIMEHIKGMAIISNPLVNSYKRLVPGYEAPIYIAWSATNRSPLIRIPVTKRGDTRVELRCPDPSSNPYLLFAVCLAAGLDGIKRNLTPPESIDKNVFDMSTKEIEELGIERLPDCLKDAIRCAEADQFIKEVLGDRIYNSYIEKKNREWEEYTTQVTKWETEKYLHRF